MPKLSDLIKTMEVKLPVSGVTVQIKAAPTYKDSKEIMKTLRLADSDTSEGEAIDQSFAMVQRVFKGWNLLEDDGVTGIPFNEENFEKLPMKDVNFLIDKVTSTIRLRDDEEKKSQEE